jgi:hypothetical protein
VRNRHRGEVNAAGGPYVARPVKVPASLSWTELVRITARESKCSIFRNRSGRKGAPRRTKHLTGFQGDRRGAAVLFESKRMRCAISDWVDAAGRPLCSAGES